MQNRPMSHSLGIVQRAPTQFDEPLYRYLAKYTDLKFVVYYYGADEVTVPIDAEIGRTIGWGTTADRGYPARFFQGVKPFQFARQVVLAKHDLIIISGYNERHALYTALVAKANGVPTGLRSDNVLPSTGQRARYWLVKRVIYPLLFRLYTTGHPVGRQAGQYLLKYGFHSDSLFRFPYAVDQEWFALESSRARADGAKLRVSWGLPANGQVVCGVMKFSEREDPLTLVRAFKMAQVRIPGLTLLLVGDGPLRQSVEEAAGEQLGRSILLPGYQSYTMLPSVYGASDLFVHTARGAWEVSVNEALASGLPVVTSDAVGSAQELVLPRALGYTFRHGDADGLAKRILDVLTDRKMLNKAREYGLSSLQEWGYPATAQRLISAADYARESRERGEAAADSGRGKRK